jgi:hypothetical protein
LDDPLPAAAEQTKFEYKGDEIKLSSGKVMTKENIIKWLNSDQFLVLKTPRVFYHWVLTSKGQLQSKYT